MTPQYAGLRTLHQDNEAAGFTVLGFPCNQFGAQEPGSDEEILAFATSKYDVNFPMFSKIEVNGDGACDLYKYLKAEQADEEGKDDIAWNFTKFLVNGDGAVVGRFAPTATPEQIGEALPSYL
jgi:glutathione peroxidase